MFATGSLQQPSGGGGSKKGGPHPTPPPGLVARALKIMLRTVGVAALTGACMVAAAPTILSWEPARNAALSFANKSIPGKASVKSVSLGWSQPINVEGLSVNNKDGEEVLAIEKISSDAPLWSLVTRQSGLGGVVVERGFMDIRVEGPEKIARWWLAFQPPEKALKRRRIRADKPPPTRRDTGNLPPENIQVVFTVKVPGGDFSVKDSHLIVEAETAAIMGRKAHVDVLFGPLATAQEPASAEVAGRLPGGIPVVANLWSECVYMEAVGAADVSKGSGLLARPMKAEMALTPPVGAMILGKTNPLLAAVVGGPEVKEEDLPDIVMSVTPKDMVLPTEEYHVRFEPMRAVVARGSILEDVMALVRGKRPDGNTISIRTSAMEGYLHVDHMMKGSRADILIGDGLHVATWGTMDYENDVVDVGLAIPADTLKNFLPKLTKLPPDYHLLVPVGGTCDNPKVDVLTAGKEVARLIFQLQTRLPLPELNVEKKMPVPARKHPLPWSK